MGIDETLRLIHVIKNDVIELMSIDYDLVGKELGELDGDEKKELMIEVGSAIIQILAAIKLSTISGPVFSKIIKVIS
jgi:hypothetical protein